MKNVYKETSLITFSEKGLEPDSNTDSHIVYSYLRTMERRDLEAAQKMLAPDFQMIFPGNACFSKLEDLVEYGKSRQKTALKVFTTFDQVVDGDCSVVYASGTLFGQRLDGSSYSGVRFVDRFTVCRGLLRDQLVWNDMGRHGFGGERQLVPSDVDIEVLYSGRSTKESEAALQYLRALEQADRDLVHLKFSTKYEGVIPGGTAYASAEEFGHASTASCKKLQRKFQRVDEIRNHQGSTIYIFGVLDGITKSEVAFRNVRFIDRLVLSADGICSHMNWDDLGEYRLTEV